MSRPFYSMFVDDDGHWVTTCDVCSRESRSPKPHESMSNNAVAMWIHALYLHHIEHPRPEEVEAEIGLGADVDVVPLDGALGTDEDLAVELEAALIDAIETAWDE